MAKRFSACIPAGLMGDLKDCGFRSDWYAYVFVASIFDIAPAIKTKRDF